MKAFTDDKFNVAKLMKFIFESVQIIAEKREILVIRIVFFFCDILYSFCEKSHHVCLNFFVICIFLLFGQVRDIAMGSRLNALSNDKFLHWSELKEFAYNKIIIT